jgi:hypothetical protein
METLEALAETFSMGEPAVISNLMLFPIMAAHPSADFDFRTLEEGMNSGSIAITEPGHGYRSVNIQNNYQEEAFIIDGEGISGGMQNRIAANSMVISGQKSQRVPVYCCEQGRWAGSSQFAFSNTIAYPSIRDLNTRSKTSLGTRVDMQSSVWKEISRKQKSLKVHSPTGSMQDIYKKKPDELERFKEYTPKDNQVGVLAATQKGLLCVDIFYNHALFGKFCVKLLISYALDALEDETAGRGALNFDKWPGFFQDIWKSALMPKKAASSELPYRFQTSKNTGTGKVLFYKNSMVHAAFFSP